VPYLTVPYLTVPYLTVPYLTVPYLTVPYVTVPCLTLPCLTLPYRTVPCLHRAVPGTKRMVCALRTRAAGVAAKPTVGATWLRLVALVIPWGVACPAAAVPTRGPLRGGAGRAISLGVRMTRRPRIDIASTRQLAWH